MNLLNGISGGDHRKACLLPVGEEGPSDASLVGQEGGGDRGCVGDVHPCLEVVQRLEFLPEQDAIEQATGASVEDDRHVRDRDTRVELLDPLRVPIANLLTHDRRECVTIRDHHESGTQQRFDLMTDLIVQVRRIQQGSRPPIQLVDLRIVRFDELTQQLRSGQSDVGDGDPVGLEAVGKQAAVEAPAHMVRPFDDDQASTEPHQGAPPCA